MKKILVSGPIFNTPSGPSGQGGKLYLQLKQEGYPVSKRSFYQNKVLRFFDNISFLLFKSHKYDVVLLQMFALRAFIMEDIILRICLLLGKKYVAVIRGGAFIEFYNKHEKWCEKVLSRIHLIATPSYFIKNHIESQGFKVTYIPNFVDISRFPYRRNVTSPHAILWVRAFHDIYHPELAIETIAVLRSQFPEVKLTMVGPDMGLQKACEVLIAEKGLQQHIQLTGSVPNDQLHEYYHTHRVYLNTTRYESFGVALVEAGACGIPCVSTEVGEIPYIWKNEENILFAERHPEAFAAQISRIFKDADLERRLSEYARENASKFTWENVRHHWVNILEKL